MKQVLQMVNVFTMLFCNKDKAMFRIELFKLFYEN